MKICIGPQLNAEHPILHGYNLGFLPEQVTGETVGVQRKMHDIIVVRKSLGKFIGETSLAGDQTGDISQGKTGDCQYYQRDQDVYPVFQHINPPAG